MEGPRGSFAAYVEWVLAQCDSLFIVCPVDEDIASPDSTPEPDPSQPSAMPATDHKPEPTTDSEPDPAVTQEPEHFSTGQIHPGALAHCGV